MALLGCHGSAGGHASLQIQEPGAAAQPGAVPCCPLGRCLSAPPVLPLQPAPLVAVLLLPVYVVIRSRIVTCGSKGRAGDR